MSFGGQLEVGGWLGRVVVTVWIDAGAGGTSVVTAIGWDGRVCWVSCLVLLASVRSSSSGTRVTGLVRCANSIGVLHMVSGETSTTDSAEFSIFLGLLVGFRSASALEPATT